jgi:hypothetical protein
MTCPVHIHPLLAAIHWFKRPHPHGDPSLRCHPPPPLFNFGWFRRVEGSHASGRRRVRGVPSSLWPFSPLSPLCFGSLLLSRSFVILALLPLFLLVLPLPVLLALQLTLCGFPACASRCPYLPTYQQRSPREHDAMGGRQLETESWSPAGFNAGSI